MGGLSGGLSGALGAVSGAVAAPAIADALAAAHIEGPLASAITAAASAAVGGLVGGSVGASTSVNEVVNNYLQHSTNWRSSQWGAFKEELARCQATSGCNVDGVYQRWTAIGNDQQKAAMSSMDAMLGADPSAAAEAGKNFGAAAAAMAVSPVDVCATGDARCAGFVGQQNNQAAAILRTGLVVAYANDLVEGGGRGATTPAGAVDGKKARDGGANEGAGSTSTVAGPVTHRPVPDLLAEANTPINDAGISQAARAWDKHSGRSGGTFEPLSGTTAEKNAAASNWISDVLSNPQTTVTQLPRGGVSYRLPNGQGVVFEPGGKVNLLDPTRPK